MKHSGGGTPKPIPARQASNRNGRILWLAVTVLFFGLIALSLWVYARTTAKAGYGTGRHEHSMDESSAPMETVVPGLPAVSPLPFPPDYFSEGTKPRKTEEESAKPDPDPPAETADTADTAEAADTAETAVTEEATTGSDRIKDDEIVYHRRKNDRMEIALSFDDGPHPRLTPVILDILREYGVKATFFMVGENVGYYRHAAEAVAAEGHEIGNHTFSHRKFNGMSEFEMRREISACEEALADLTNAPVRFIRPPEGQMNETMRRVMGALHYRIILWDVDTRDWAHTPPQQIASHILDTVQAGDIILMHDFIGYNSPTPEALRLVIPALLERGYRFVTVGELVDGD